MMSPAMRRLRTLLFMFLGVLFFLFLFRQVGFQVLPVKRIYLVQFVTCFYFCCVQHG